MLPPKASGEPTCCQSRTAGGTLELPNRGSLARRARDSGYLFSAVLFT